MFLKPYKLKSNSPLKSSDTKRLRQRLEKDFPMFSAEELLTLIPAKANVTLLKLITQASIKTNVYCVEKLPAFFEIENNVLVPTLYALWQLPTLLPYFTTWSAVLPNLSNGADLMLPGVVPQGTGMNMYGHFKKDQLVGINLTSNPSAVGVGILTRSSDDLYMSGGKGQAVRVLHIFGDKLWSHEPALTQQIPQNKPKELHAEDFPALGELPKKHKEPLPIPVSSNQQEKLEVEDFPALCESPRKQQEITNKEEILEILLTNLDKIEDITTQKDLTPEQILKNAFLAALKNNGQNLQLPLLTSNFYRLYVVPEAPENFDLKKTRYKKLSNFLKEMIDEGFVVVREESKGVDKITSIDLKHPAVVNFITDFKQSENSKSEPLFHASFTHVYTVTDATAAFFTKMNYKRGESIPATQISHIIREYISKYELKLADEKTRAILLDETLEQLCECTKADTKKICAIVLHKMENSYQMCSAKDITNNKPCIQMSLATRSGNKKVTLVSNVECYGIILSEFIKLCKQGAAASTTIVKLPNQKHEQLQIQGNQIRFVYKLLTETYKVPPKFILGLELAVKEKKKTQKK